MYRLTSVFFIFFSLGFFFLIVGNLTYINNEKNEDIPFLDIEKKSKNSTDSKQFLISKEKDLYFNKSEDILEKKKESSEKLIKKVTEIKKVEKELDSTLIQFGAFSMKKNAEDIKKEIDFKIRKKFKDFGLEIISNEDNKIYKLVYRLKETKRATEICNYSKTIKIDCYVKKK
jgi:hypothetical protein